MSDRDTSPVHVIRLSSIDQSLHRTYIRFALCFPVDVIHMTTIATKLSASVQRAVSHIPILGGYVKPASETNDRHRGHLEGRVTLDEVESLMPVIRRLYRNEFPLTFEELISSSFPPATLINQSLTPEPDKPAWEGSRAFVVQANFLAGGVIIALYLHHSIADIIGLNTIIYYMSSDYPDLSWNDEQLKEEATVQSRLRDRLSGSGGVSSLLTAHSHPAAIMDPAQEVLQDATLTSDEATCNVFYFNLALIQDTANILNEHLKNMKNDYYTHLSLFDTITAIIWKGIARARELSKPAEQQCQQEVSTAIIPVDIRQCINPPLDNFFGNALMNAHSTAAVDKLIGPYNTSYLTDTAKMIRTSINGINENQVRSVIASINESGDGQATPNKKVHFRDDIIITSWSNLSLENAHVGLGLGKPAATRKLGRAHSAHEVIVHPMKVDENVWEVTVQLKTKEMEALMRDVSFMEWVVKVAA